jgi:type II restriction/modification system DNA methylase subunit YeeA
MPEANTAVPEADKVAPEADKVAPEADKVTPEADKVTGALHEVTGGAGNVVTETPWPEADFIIGNPPFLGGSKLRRELGDAYTESLWKCYAGRVDGGADLVTYWFEKARALIEAGKVQRAGFICTNGIRFGANRKVLERIKATGDIFEAWADREWVLDGAAVRVSIVAFDGGHETEKHLDGKPVATIHSDLTAKAADVTTAKILTENNGIVYAGMKKHGAFDLEPAEAEAMLAKGGNPNNQPNSDVVRPILGGTDVAGRPRGKWIIDFATMPEEDASLYEVPFEYVRQHVKPERDTNNRAVYRELWWIFGEPRPALRAAIAGLERCIATPEVSKHRIFVWMPTTTVPDNKLHVFARDDDYFFGVLHSRIHEVWSLALGNRMGVGNDPVYSSSKTFGTFPLPWPPGTEPSEADSDTLRAIADAARRLVTLRDTWFHAEGLSDAERKKRTLTNLYNTRPTWLDNAHKTLDAAVAAAYNWPPALDDDTLLERLLALNRER